MPLESQIVDRILKYLNNEVEDCVAEKVMGNAFQFGRPDINGCWRGRCFRIEVKTPDHGNKPSKAQELNLAKWARAGALSFVAYSVDDVKPVINNRLGFLEGDEMRYKVKSEAGKKLFMLSYTPRNGLKLRSKKTGRWWQIIHIDHIWKKATAVEVKDPHADVWKGGEVKRDNKKGGKKK